MMIKQKSNIRALSLLSGGLDSTLTIKILQEQGIEVTGVGFVSYFFNTQASQKAASQLGVDFKEINFSNEHLAMVKNPRYGRGRAMNPCIDCHILMLKKAKQLMEEEGYSFVATGEVLGQRPMSQNKRALELVANQSGLDGYLVRPLSARLLKSSLPEEKKWLDRERLLAISGRSRKEQIILAKKYKIKEYPSPAGGCLLTEKEYGEKLKRMLDFWEDAEGEDIKLLKAGRHFWVEDDLIAVGRNQRDNQLIKDLSQSGDILIEPEEFKGPTVLIRSKDVISEKAIEKAGVLIVKYSKKN